jgi:hypothetical protein
MGPRFTADQIAARAPLIDAGFRILMEVGHAASQDSGDQLDQAEREYQRLCTIWYRALDESPCR